MFKIDVSTRFCCLKQAASDQAEFAQLLNISDTQLNYITNAGVGKGLIRCGGNIVPFESQFPKESKLYQLMTTKLDELTDEDSGAAPRGRKTY